MPGDGSTFRGRIRNLLRSNSVTKLKRSGWKEPLHSQVTLEKVLGVTATGNSGLASDPCSGAVAYPAGCVVVLLNPKTNRQQHIINTTRKTITALSFSPDGKYLVTGESGHLPAVRLWDVAEQRQVAELQSHKYGVSCVAFSPNGKYVVSVGNQHDMLVNVWAWKKDVVVAANKVSSKVTGVSFSEDNSYFITVGNRHIKFWYLDHCKTNKSGAPVPLLGRSGLLGELRNNFFCAVACGRGSKSDSAFCITSSGLLCELNHRRMLDKWVDLRTGTAQSLCVSEDLVFCGCADGTVRAFGTFDLSFICTLPRPHPLGSVSPAPDHSSQVFSSKMDAKYPDALAVAFDPVRRWVTCVYNDHSLYVWDVTDLNRVGKVHSALYHGACVWDLETFPDVQSPLGLPSGSFLTCSSDNTIRMWALDSPQPPNPLSTDLLNILHVDGNSSSLVDLECSNNADKSVEGHPAETRAGIRTISISPDGKHLASGDRNGILRVHDLSKMEEILKVEAHDAEILCLEYSKPDTGLKFLATASRDRLIHVLDADRDYSLVQTLDEHSSSITAVRFTANDDKVRVISCGADKSVYFRTAHKTDRGTEFRRSHHSVQKSTLYDMSVDPTSRYAAVGCQDRCIRLFHISSGKQKKLYKGSLSEDGSLLKVQIDPSGRYVATSCSDKNISIVDFSSGECVATVFGHSEIVTGIKFTNDCKHLISVSGDSCIFVWRLAPELTLNMRERLCQLREEPGAPLHRDNGTRREVFSALPLGGLSSESDRDPEGNAIEEEHTVTSTDSSPEDDDEEEEEEEGTGGSDEGQDREERTKPKAVAPEQRNRPRRRWSHRMVSLELMVKSMLDLRQLDTLGHKSSPVQSRDRRSMSNLNDTPVDERTRRRRAWLRSDWSSQSRSVLGAEEVPPFPEERADSSDSVTEPSSRGQWRGRGSESQDSPDSACSLGYDSRESSLDHLINDVDSLTAVSSDEEASGGERLRGVTVSSVEEALRAVTEDHGPGDFHKNNDEALAPNSTAERSPVPRRSMSSHFLNRVRNRRSAPVFGTVHGKEQDGPCTQPPVSKVRPLMGDEQDRSSQDDLSTSTRSLTSDSVVIPRAEKKTSRHVWRLSIPSTKASSFQDTSAGLHKSQSVQNLAYEPPASVSSCDRRLPLKRPQHLFLNQTKPPRPSTSPHSPNTPPSPRTLRSYMNPTASSKAKISRSSSVGEGLHVGTPPRSPSLTRASRDAAGALFTAPCPAAVLPLRASVTPRVVSPSRIPLPKQQHTPRRSLVLECGLSRSPTPSRTGPGSDAALAADKQASDRHQSLEPLPLEQKTTCALESAEENEQEAVVKGRPPVDEEGRITSGGSQEGRVTDESITVETCRQVVSELQDCLRRTIHFYTSVVDSGPDLTEDQQRMKSVLSTALLSVKTELHSLPPHSPQQGGPEGGPQGGPQGGRAEGDSTSALLEQYAQLLLQSVEKKLENKA